jgi:hypothetical protein
LTTATAVPAKFPLYEVSAMLLFLCERTEYGVPIKEKVHVYECTFSTLILNPKTEKTYRGEVRVLVVCDTIEDQLLGCET